MYGVGRVCGSAIYIVALRTTESGCAGYGPCCMVEGGYIEGILRVVVYLVSGSRMLLPQVWGSGLALYLLEEPGC